TPGRALNLHNSSNSYFTNFNTFTTGSYSYGIHFISSHNNTLSNFTITTNGSYAYATYLDSSHNNTLLNFSLNSTQSNSLYLTGTELSHYQHNFTNVSIRDIPIYYYATGYSLDCPTSPLNFSNASFVGFAGCPDVVLENSTITDGLLFAFSNGAKATNITLTTPGRALNLHNSSNSYFTNFNTFTTGSYSYGIHFISSHNNTLSNFNISTSAEYAYGIYLPSSHNNTLSNFNISTSGHYAYGIYLPSSHNNTLSNFNISTNGYYAYVTYLSSSHNNTLSNCILNTTRTSVPKLYFYSASNNIISNCTFLGQSVNQTYIRSAGNNFLLNITNLNRSAIAYGTSPTAAFNVTVQWYVRLNITTPEGTPIESASANYTNNQSLTEDMGTTGANGLTDWYILNDTMFRGAGGNIVYSLHNFTANKTGYETNSTNETINESKTVNMILFGGGPPPDTTPPTITIHSPENTTYTTQTIQLNVSADEDIDTWWYSLNGGENTTFTPNTTITAVEGVNNLTVYANDTAGNVGEAHAEFTYSPPTPPPEEEPERTISVRVDGRCEDNPINITTYDGSSPLPNVLISIYLKTTPLEKIADLFTNSEGIASTLLQRGTYLMRFFKPGYLQKEIQITIISCEQPAPYVNLISPPDGSSFSEGTQVSFTYSTNLHNCSLYINSETQTSFTLLLQTGNYSWKVVCQDESGISYSSETWSLSIIPACRKENRSCSTDAECCEGLLCRNSICTSCRKIGDACESSMQCCEGVCLMGRCSLCIQQGGECSSDADCCSPNICINGMCMSPSLCAPLHASCLILPCCPGGECINSICSRTPSQTGGTPADVGKKAACVVPPEEIRKALNLSEGEKICCIGKYVNNRCIPCFPSGFPCNSSSQCCDGICMNGVCTIPPMKRAPAPLGSPCNTTVECEEGFCNNSVCTTIIIKPPEKRKLNEACIRDEDCAEGRCIDYICQIVKPTPIFEIVKTVAPKQGCAPFECSGFVCKVLCDSLWLALLFLSSISAYLYYSAKRNRFYALLLFSAPLILGVVVFPAAGLVVALVELVYIWIRRG
ncbi:MAG: NosD domain-containing protein, partial [Candidatus Micrarchaeia archaeon]